MIVFHSSFFRGCVSVSLRCGTSLTTLVVFAAFSSAALADDGGWKMPNLNPFSQKVESARAASAASPPTSGFKWPKLPSRKAAPKAQTNQPGALQKMASGTKTFFSKTADALNPWDDAQEKAPQKITGSGSIFSQASAKRKQQQETETSSFLPTMPWSSKEEKKPKTVNDFLSQPRPGY